MNKKQSLWSAVFKTLTGKKSATPPTLPSVKPKRGMTMDGWANAMTGLGTSRDKVLHAEFMAAGRLTDEQLAAMYNEGDLSRRVVELVPKEAFRPGYDVLIGGSLSGTKALREKAALLKLDQKVVQAWIWGRLFGGSLLILGAVDGKSNLASPLKKDSVKDIKWLRVVDRRFVYPVEFYDNIKDAKYGEPKVYRVYLVPASAQAQPPSQGYVDIHESRTFRFDGADVDVLRQRSQNGWGGSVLQAPYDAMRQCEITFQAVSNLAQDASQAVFGMEGLIDAIASGQEDAIRQRLELIDMSRSVARAVVLDSGAGETFERKTTQFAGLPEILDRMMMRFSAAAEAPVSLVFGRSPAGLNATGESELRNFYASVDAKRESEVKPVLVDIYTMLSASMATPGVVSSTPPPLPGKADANRPPPNVLDPVTENPSYSPVDITSEVEMDMEGADTIDIKFHSLWALTDVEQSELEFKVAQKDQIYIGGGVLLPTEVAMSRFGQGKYSTVTTVDTSALEKLTSKEQDDRLNPPPPAVGAAPTAQATPAAPDDTNPKAKKLENGAYPYPKSRNRSPSKTSK